MPPPVPAPQFTKTRLHDVGLAKGSAAAGSVGARAPTEKDMKKIIFWHKQRPWKRYEKDDLFFAWMSLQSCDRFGDQFRNQKDDLFDIFLISFLNVFRRSRFLEKTQAKDNKKISKRCWYRAPKMVQLGSTKMPLKKILNRSLKDDLFLVFHAQNRPKLLLERKQRLLMIFLISV